MGVVRVDTEGARELAGKPLKRQIHHRDDLRQPAAIGVRRQRMVDQLRAGAPGQPRELAIRPPRIGGEVANAAEAAAGRGTATLVRDLDQLYLVPAPQLFANAADVDAGPRLRCPPREGGVDQHPHRVQRPSSPWRSSGAPPNARIATSPKSNSRNTEANECFV